MKNSSRQSRTVPVLFAVTVFLFSVFFAYMTPWATMPETG